MPERVAEMLMFHDAAGGKVYTGLTHLPLSTLDLSHVLVEDRCLLVGRSENALIDLQLTSQSGGASDDSQMVPLTGKTLSLVRILLPMKTID